MSCGRVRGYLPPEHIRGTQSADGRAALRGSIPSSRLGMVVGARDDELGIGNCFQDSRKGLHQRLQPFVGAPVSDGENAKLRIAAFRKIRRTGVEAKVPCLPSRTFSTEYFVTRTSDSREEARKLSLLAAGPWS